MNFLQKKLKQFGKNHSAERKSKDIKDSFDRIGLKNLGRAVAIHSYKGGTGKTCLTASLAATLALKGKNVCLLEYDFRGPSLHSLFKEKKTQYWLNDYLDEICPLTETLTDYSQILHTAGKLYVGLADPNPTRIRDMLTRNRKWEQKALQNILKDMQDLYKNMKIDYLIFDTSPGLQYSSINAIAASDFVLLLTKMDTFDYEGTTRMIPEIYQLLEKKVGLVVNQVVPGLEQQVENMAKTLNIPVICKVPIYADESMYLLTKEILPISRPEHPFNKQIEQIANCALKL